MRRLIATVPQTAGPKSLAESSTPPILTGSWDPGAEEPTGRAENPGSLVDRLLVLSLRPRGTCPAGRSPSKPSSPGVRRLVHRRVRAPAQVSRSGVLFPRRHRRPRSPGPLGVYPIHYSVKRTVPYLPGHSPLAERSEQRSGPGSGLPSQLRSPPVGGRTW